MFRTVPLSIIRSFFLYCTHSNGVCHAGLLTACEQCQDDSNSSFTVKNLVMMDRGTAQNT
jgi:hypothetical protein